MRKSCISIILSILLVQAVFGTSYADAKADRFFFEKQGRAIWDIPTNKKIVALTFDDGPSETYTPLVLDVLKKYQAKATFFVVGERAESSPQIIKRQVKAGHEVANHTYSHPNIRTMSKKALTDEILHTNAIIHGLTGYTPKLFRPPGGAYNESIIYTANEAGFTVVLWSWHQDTLDWKQPGTSTIVRNVVNNVRNGDIILFHDYGGNRMQTVNALKKILPRLKKEGYEFVTVSQLTTMNPDYRYLNLLRTFKYSLELPPIQIKAIESLGMQLNEKNRWFLK
ncbi:polysaccharide deacetylase family protein [Halobacillus salinarum]|uniref:Polysaccharide deacetylase family protein n=1 Tax=Halobacillus salinarum TaxID=2932257 RepID=A0ABY4EMG6_9BACI|nr:polysaccharide deacetylase family protein [Halobacillus salinarum]UOQ43301.1 polysaccharide deacetylase family protein [Halobacillus salinarum]